MRRGSQVMLVAALMVMVALACAVGAASEYANPEALASTEWLAAYLDDPTVRTYEGKAFPCLVQDSFEALANLLPLPLESSGQVQEHHDCRYSTRHTCPCPPHRNR